MRRLLPLLAAIAAAATAVVAAASDVLGPRSRYEEPSYDVHARHDGFEVRTYAPTVEARVTMSGPYDRAIRSGFGVLAGYIFGDNDPGTSIDMTTPVAAEPAGEPVDMTAPVAATESPRGWTVSFTMPSEHTLATLPRPRDPRVQLVAVDASTYAVRTFSGRARDDVVARELAALRADMDRVGLTPAGPPVVAQFDPPWTLGPWRRNEVRFPVGTPAAG